MEKVIIRIVIILVLFFGLFYGLQQIDWMTLFKIEETTKSNEEKFGELIWDSINGTETIVKDESVNQAIDSLVTAICEANDIDREEIKVHVIEKWEVNAFALPNNHLIIYTGLINACENEAELCGVISHELAHLQLGHVMKKMVKEIGLATIISMTAGNGGAQVVLESLKHLTSTAYDRSLETEADIKAVDYMVKAKIDPEQFANFLYGIGGDDSDISKFTEWINTHPNSQARAEEIITYSLTKTDMEFESILSDESWVELQLGSGY